MRFILLILVAVTAFAGDDLPPAAKKVMDQRDAAVAKANEQAIKDLTKVLTDLTKAGDLDGALAVRKQIESLRKPETHDVLGNPIVAPEQAFLGKWNLPGTGEFSVQPKGVAVCSACAGKWSIDDDKLVIAWANGYTDTYAAPVNGVMVGANNNGKLLKASALAGFDGTWKLHYTNGAIRTYVIEGESIRFLEEKKTGKIKVSGGKATVDFKDGQFEVLSIDDGKIASDFFRSNETFKAKAADFTATGTLVPTAGK